MSRTKWIVIVAVLILAGIAVGIILYNKLGVDGAAENKIELISTFVEGGAIPARYTCDDEDVSPAMAWSGVPKETKSLALIVEDPDAPGETFYHWVIYNIPSVLTGLAEGIEQVETVPGVGVQGKNDF